MKKKIMAVTLCLAMVSTFAVGCGQKNETDSGKSEEKSSGKVEIEFVQVKREAAESYTKVIEAFEKENPDIVIKQNVVPDAQEVLMTRASSDSLPDMMNHWPTDAQFVQFEDEGLLLDLSEKDYMKNIDSKYLDAVKAKDGKNYIAPYNVNFMGVYYNKDKFEEAGYTMPTKWDELIALAEEIKAKGETPFILPNKDSWTVSNLWSNIEARDLGSHEDEFEKMKAGEESFETIPEYKSSVEKMIQLLDYANEDSLALGYDQAINDFANGEGWMFLQGSWTLPSFLSANPDFNVEFTILPNDNGKPIATQAVDTGLIPMCSYAIARNMEKRYYKTMYFYLLAGIFVPFQVIMVPLVKYLAKLKLCNIPGLIIMCVTLASSQGVFLLVNYIRSVPRDLEEAAYIDGCGTVKAYVKIVLPMIKPILATIFVLNALWVWNDFQMPLLILNQSQDMWTLPLFQYNFKSQYSFDYNLAFASYLIAMIPVLIAYACAQKHIVSGLTQGAVKS